MESFYFKNYLNKNDFTFDNYMDNKYGPAIKKITFFLRLL